MLGPEPEVLINLGAKRTDLILDGQVYRLFAPMILHAGVFHLLANMAGLFMCGIPMEREFGGFRIGAVFIVSGLFGCICSAIFVPEVIGVGASGGLFGLFGAAWADLIQNWSLYRNTAWTTFLQLSICTVVNALFGLMPYLDNFAHVGGFLCGMFIGLTLLIQTRLDIYGRNKGRKDYQVCLQGISLVFVPTLLVVGLLVLFLGVCAFASPRTILCRKIRLIFFLWAG